MSIFTRPAPMRISINILYTGPRIGPWPVLRDL
jgi:hypothetical protein